MKRVIISILLLWEASSYIYAQAKVVIPDLHQVAATKFIEVKGTKYAYRVFGKKEGISLILLQHFTGTLDNWDPTVTNGLANHFRVILFDNKGIGASTGQTPDNIGAMAEDVFSFIDALGFIKVNILGFSMGGFIAQQLTLDHPNVVHKLILVGTSPKGGEGIADIIKLLAASANMGPNEQKLYLFYKPTPSSLDLGKQALDWINKRQKNRDPETNGTSIQSQLKAILNWGQSDANALTRLKEIKQSVLVVNGSTDIVVPTINSYVLFQNLPNAKLSLYPDSGHGSIFQFPELFLSEVIPFLKR